MQRVRAGEVAGVPRDRRPGRRRGGEVELQALLVRGEDQFVEPHGVAAVEFRARPGPRARLRCLAAAVRHAGRGRWSRATSASTSASRVASTSQRGRARAGTRPPPGRPVAPSPSVRRNRETRLCRAFAGSAGRVRAPHLVDQHVGRHHPAGVEREAREQRADPAAGERPEGAVGVADLELPEDRDPHGPSLPHRRGARAAEHHRGVTSSRATTRRPPPRPTGSSRCRAGSAGIKDGAPRGRHPGRPLRLGVGRTTRSGTSRGRRPHPPADPRRRHRHVVARRRRPGRRSTPAARHAAAARVYRRAPCRASTTRSGSSGTPSTPGSRRTKRSSSTPATRTRARRRCGRPGTSWSRSTVSCWPSRGTGAGVRDRPADPVLPRPRSPCAWEHLVPLELRTACPYKGRTTGYWSARIGGTTYDEIAWSYEFPTRPLLPVAGLVGFFDERSTSPSTAHRSPPVDPLLLTRCRSPGAVRTHELPGTTGVT